MTTVFNLFRAVTDRLIRDHAEHHAATERLMGKSGARRNTEKKNDRHLSKGTGRYPASSSATTPINHVDFLLVSRRVFQRFGCCLLLHLMITIASIMQSAHSRIYYYYCVLLCSIYTSNGTKPAPLLIIGSPFFFFT